ncbi:GldG family protein [Alteromonas facilis]|uniref:GldG family protein n=1 Tax=Alteromonas facilis TaxID=2048004 RepID=UPI000C28DBE4|nr:Gldg family protein [Alteromonas facilis]
MNRIFSFTLGLLLLAGLFFSLVIVNNQLLDNVRVDLTENQVYSLSQGSKEVIADIEEPINLYFFYSDTATKGMTSLRNYANRVESLLREYETFADGKIKLHVIDPVPFSESEDQAAQYGLTGAAIGQIGESVYFGLAGTNAVDDQQIIGFFDPQKETFLEYDISKLIYQLSDNAGVKVTIISDLALTGGQNPMSGQFDPPMVIYSQLEQLYDVTLLNSDANEVPEDTDVLMLAHPKNLPEPLLQSIDQYAMNGGRLLVFADPHYESDAMAMMGGMGANATVFPLLASWGVEFDNANVVLDANLGLEVRTPEGGVARHLGILGFDTAAVDSDDVVTANLESINAASVGSLSLAESSTLSMLPLITSSDNSQLLNTSVYATTQDPQVLSRTFAADEQQYTIAARFSGKAKSAFTEQKAGDTQWLKQSDRLNLIVVADADLLSDRFWVQQSNFFGQVIFTPFANNGDLFTNAVENLSGSDSLISVRSRGTFARPFTKVEALEVAAEAKFREQEERLQQQLTETENQLAQLQSAQQDTGALVVSPEQQAAIDEFVEKRIEIRKELRDVRFQLDRDIDTLGNWLKFINIAVAPLLLAILLFFFARILRTKATRQQLS